MTRGQQVLLGRVTPDGFVTATTPTEEKVAQNLVSEGVLRHHRALVYALTEKGWDRAEAKRFAEANL